MKYDGIIFDLDGTLWDSVEETQILVLLEYLKTAAGRDAPAHKRGIRRRDGPWYGRSGGEAVPVPVLTSAECRSLTRISLECEYLTEHGAKLYPHMHETLKKLSETHTLCIVSNCDNGYIQAFLKAHNMAQYFTDYECMGSTGKPKGDNIALVVEHNHLKAPVYVGDTVWDYNSATQAGVPFIFAAYGFGNVENVPKIAAPAALLHLVES